MSCAISSDGISSDCSSADASASTGSTRLPYPATRWGAEITYDAADGYPLLYGGQSDTWAFENGYWVDLHPKVVPPISSFACLAYDWTDHYVVLFGGGRGGIGTPDLDRNTTWTFRAGVWTNITSTANSPPGLQYPSCAFDAAPGAGYIVMFGGALSTGPGKTGRSGLTIHSSNLTWRFSGGRWTNISNLGAPHPSARFGASMSYDDATGYVVLYGGAVNGTSTANGSCTPTECPHLDDTWTFANGVWTNITVSASIYGTPPGRWEAGVANDSADGYVLIFGGQGNGYKSLNATKNFTWAFEGGHWTNLSGGLSIAPGTRFGEAMGYDPATASILMFSGLNATGGAAHTWNDTWAFGDGAWKPLSYILNFTESGLPKGTSWTANVSSDRGSTASATSNSSGLSFGWTTGNYSYSVASIPGFHITAGSANGSVSPSDPTISLGWSPERYTIRFSETGLRLAWKTQWSVTLGATTKRSTGRAITFGNLVPGHYDFSIGALANYTLNRSYSGTVNVSGSGELTRAATVDLRWDLVTYSLTFEEKGLPKHTNWQVTIDGRTKTSEGTKITFDLSNGTYSSVANATGFANTTATVRIDGTGVTQVVSFVPGAGSNESRASTGGLAVDPWSRTPSALVARMAGECRTHEHRSTL